MKRSCQWQSWAVVRGVLLAAVLAGLFGMHVLTAADGANGHGVMPMIGVATHDGAVVHDPSVSVTAAAMAAPVSDPSSPVDAVEASETRTATVRPADPEPGTGHAAMAACILFLALGGTVFLLGLLRHRGPLASAWLGRPVVARLTDLRRRGPPVGWPRVSLSVIRV